MFVRLKKCSEEKLTILIWLKFRENFWIKLRMVLPLEESKTALNMLHLSYGKVFGLLCNTLILLIS